MRIHVQVGAHIRTRDRCGDQPSGDQDLFATESIGEASSGVVRQGLGDAEDDDEREHAHSSG